MRDLLLVEDDGVVLAAVARLCRSEGLEVDETERVDGALASLEEESYRLALVDLMLPGRSGFELLEALRAAHPSTPVIAISGYATRDNALRTFQLGAFDFLPKPFDVAELVGVMHRGLRYAERVAGETAGRGVGGAAQRYFLGRHAWATLDADGTATVGAAESFHRVLGEISEIRLPAAGDHVTQSRMLARLAGGDEVHRIWSPLSGLIVAVNPELEGGVDLVGDDPLGSGWLVRIVPADQPVELEGLTLRQGEGEAAAGGG